MSNRRVVVTGIGLVSSLGIGTDTNWSNLVAGTSGVTRITKFDVTGYAAQIAAEVRGFDPLNWIEKKEVKKMDLFIQYAIAASQFAMDDSQLQITDQNAPDIGAFIVMELLEGSSLGSDLRRRGPMGASEAAAVMRQICAGVDAAHVAGVLHRDLKTDNIWLEDAPGDRFGNAGAGIFELDAPLAGVGFEMNSDEAFARLERAFGRVFH